MSAAAAKRTVLAAASFAAVLAVALVGPAGGAPKYVKDKSVRDRIAPTAPANPHVVKVTPSLVYVAWDPSTDNVGVAGYVVSGDGRPAIATSSSFVVSTLGCGQSTPFTVVAFDPSGNRSSRVTTTVSTAACPDTQPPTSPSGFTQGATTENAVVLNWTPSVDNVGVVNYGVYRNLARVATTSSPTVTLTGLSCGSTYDYMVDAGDASGNRSGLSSAFVQTASCSDVTPPSPPSDLSVTGQTPSSLALAWSASSDDVGVAGYHVSVNGAPTLTLTQTTASLPNLVCDKTYNLGVDGFDAAGNRSPATTVSGTTAACAASPPSTDTTPPSTPTALATSNVTRTGLTLAWHASTDDVGVTGYDVYRNGTKVGSGSSTSATQTGLTCGTAYTLGVVARDAAGNASQPAQLNAVTAACPAPAPSPDSTPPSTPTGLAASNVTATGLTLAWNSSTDNVGVTGYDVYRNGTKVGSGSSTSATQTGLTCGTAYTLGVVARDAAGNSSQTAQLNAATAACAAPAPAPDTTPPSQPSNFRVTGATATSIDLGWNASTDNVGVAGYRVYRNGVAGATTTQTSTTVSGLTCGTAYSFDVDAYDAAGNRSSKSTMSGSTSACADKQAPSAPANVSASSRTATSIALGWSASTDNVGVAGYGLYRNGVQVGTSTSTTGIFSGLTCNTNYTLAVDAYDAAGNRSGKTTTMVATTACPDTTPPSTPAGLAASSVSQTGLTLSWNASTDNVGVTGYDVYRNGTKMASVTSTSSAQTGLSCGTSYSFGVVAVDAAGNSSTQAQLTASTAACSPSAPTPTAPFDADFETGDFSQVISQQESTADRITLATSNPLQGAYSAMVKVGPSDSNVAGSGGSFRSEMAIQDFSPVYANGGSLQGKDSWVTWDEKLDSNWEMGDSWSIITQFLGSTGTYFPCFAILANGPAPGILYASVRGGTPSPTDNTLRSVVLANPLPLGQILHFKVHHHWSTGSDGVVNVYLNGALKATINGPNLWSGYEDTIYQKGGAYRSSGGITRDSQLWIDNVRWWKSDPG